MKQTGDGPIEVNPEAFDDAFRTYARRWMFKHPTPSDFFRTMEDVGGRRLDWFWRELFLENPHFDQAVASVADRPHKQHAECQARLVMCVTYHPERFSLSS